MIEAGKVVQPRWYLACKLVAVEMQNPEHGKVAQFCRYRPRQLIIEEMQGLKFAKIA